MSKRLSAFHTIRNLRNSINKMAPKTDFTLLHIFGYKTSNVLGFEGIHFCFFLRERSTKVHTNVGAGCTHVVSNLR